MSNQLNSKLIQTYLSGIEDQYKFIAKNINNKEMVEQKLKTIEIRTKLVKDEILKYYN